MLLDVAKQLRRSPAQVALNWVATQPGVSSTIIGASKLNQLEDNLSAIEFPIPAELRARLDAVSAPASLHPYIFFEPFIQGMIHGGVSVHGWAAQRKTTQQQPAREPEMAGTER